MAPRWHVLLAPLMVAACQVQGPYAAVDGSLVPELGTDSATETDGGAALDAGEGDAGGSSDGGVSADSGSPVGVACSVLGTAGTCQLVSECSLVTTPGYCPGPTEVRCCHPPVDAGVRADLGTFACDPDVRPTPNAGLVEAAGVDGCPAGMRPVSASLCVDQFEAFVRIDRGTGAAPEDWSPYHHPPALAAGESLVAYSVAGAIPQGQISGVQAANACSGAGKRLCSNTEWLSACRGPSNRVYPYGDTRLPGVCNDARALHPAVEYFGTSASWIWSMLGHPCIAQIPDSLDPTGANTGCVSEHGAYDMMGNLHEWTSDPNGTFRGGFFADTTINGNGCLYATTAHNTQHWDYSTGFRCCADR